MITNRDKLESLAQALLEQETLDQDDAYAAAGIESPREVQNELQVEAGDRLQHSC